MTYTDVMIKTEDMIVTPQGTMVDRTDFQHEMVISYTSHKQLSQMIKVPGKYYERMYKKNRKLWVDSVNSWLRKKENLPEVRMFRKSGDIIEAIVSDRFRRVDNEQILEFIKDSSFLENHGLKSKGEYAHNNGSLKMQFTTDRHEMDIDVGDPVQAGCIISNNDFGSGRTAANGIINRLVCSNGMIVPKIVGVGYSQIHLSKRIEYDKNNRILEIPVLTDDVKDGIVESVNLAIEQFKPMVQKLREASQKKINFEDWIIQVKNKYLLTKKDVTNISNYYTEEDGVGNLWGGVNAITQYAHDLSNERRFELEEIAGELVV